MNSTTEKTLDLLARWTPLALSIAIVEFLGFNFLLILWLVVGGPLLCGYLFTNWFIKKKYKKTLIQVLTWLNIIFWFIPILGLFTASVAFTASLSPKYKERKYKILGAIGLTLSLINVGASVYMSLAGII